MLLWVLLTGREQSEGSLRLCTAPPRRQPAAPPPSALSQLAMAKLELGSSERAKVWVLTLRCGYARCLPRSVSTTVISASGSTGLSTCPPAIASGGYENDSRVDANSAFGSGSAAACSGDYPSYA